MSFADHFDLQTRWPSLTADQFDQADVLLGDASIFLRTQYPGVDVQAQSDADLAAVLTVVACAMVKRAMLSVTPGAANEAVATGPYSHSITYANPSGNLFVTDAEDRMIRGYLPRAVTMSMADY